MNIRQTIRETLQCMVIISREDIESAVMSLDIAGMIADEIADQLPDAIRCTVEEEVANAVSNVLENI